MHACRLALVAIVLGVTACHAAAPAVPWRAPVGREHPLVGRIWHAPGSRFVDERALVSDVTRATYVLLGESHDNVDHHALQARLVRAVLAGGRRSTVAFEMLTPAQAPALARHLAEHPGDAAGIGAAVDWKASGWPPWSMYEPIAAAALEAGVPIVPANLDAPQIRALMRQGPEALERPLVDRYALDRPATPDITAAMTEEITESHCGHAPADLVPRMILVQRARDAVMADALLGAADGAILIAGSGHTRTDRGVPAYVRRVVPAARIVSVAFVEVAAGRGEPRSYEDRYGGRLPFDYVWFTPATDDADPCEKFKSSLERLKRP